MPKSNFTFRGSLSILILLMIVSCVRAPEYTYQVADCQLPTRWTNSVGVENAWPQYPRPEMIREAWKNLNGLWDYAIQDSSLGAPEAWDGKILVPYPVESSLSGVKRKVNADQKLWYSTDFRINRSWKGKRVLLNFEAVDWQTTVWVNGQYIGSHKGGYDPFSFDISRCIE